MIPIYKPYMPENLMPELNEILYSGQLTFGKYGKQFESQLKEFIATFPSDMKGESFGSSECIRTVHNSFARPEPFISDDKNA